MNGQKISSKSILERIRQWRWERDFLGIRRQSSGIEVAVKNAADLIIYNEVFIDGAYDIPIQAALRNAVPGKSVFVLDLGANVGYFILRLADLAVRESTGEVNWAAVAVEGCPDTFVELSERMHNEPDVREHVRTCLGLVGRKSGWGAITLDPYHFAASVKDLPSPGLTVQVPYANLDGLVKDEVSIDLLKCDIEGAEEEFLENYENLLSRVRLLCIELHGVRRKERCLGLLFSYGFKNQQQLSVEGEGDSQRWVYCCEREY